MGTISLITDRAAPALAYEDVKSYAKIDGDADKFMINLLIGAAADYYETFTNRTLITKTFAASFQGFDGNELRKGQFQSLTGITYLLNGTVTTYTPLTDFDVDNLSDYPVLYTLDDVSPPMLDPVAAPVTVTWKAGYGDTPATIPMQTRLALFQLVLFMYENRGDYDTGNLPVGLKSMLEQQKIRSLRG